VAALGRGSGTGLAHRTQFAKTKTKSPPRFFPLSFLGDTDEEEVIYSTVDRGRV